MNAFKEFFTTESVFYYLWNTDVVEWCFFHCV